MEAMASQKIKKMEKAMQMKKMQDMEAQLRQ